ncbi:TonB-dependent receptor [Pseudomonas sp. Je.1.5.c]|uniref:TonB-dependent siderophore receptor n=1 Tax=Pseudomonas sp. Je.1.5.c TaxID=3142839 RepID=UPI003DA97719
MRVSYRPTAALALAINAAICAASIWPAIVEASAEARVYEIPPSPLSEALARFADQAGVTLTFDTSLTQGRMSSGLVGAYTVESGFSALLAQSGLQAAEQSNGVTILRAGEEGAVTLGITQIEGAAYGAFEPPAAYDGGQVATGARVGMLGNKSIMDTPFSITSYTAQHMENQQANTVASVLRSDASVRIRTSEGHTQENFMIRGFRVDSADLAIDGLFGLAPDGHVPTEFLERVEVLKGPGAMLTGMPPAGGVGGVINLVPKRALDTPLTRLTTSFVSDSYVAEHLDISRRFGAEERFGIRFNGVSGDGETGVDDQSKERALWSLAADYRGDGWRLGVDGYENRERTDDGSPIMIGFTNIGTVPRAPDPSTNLLKGVYVKQENSMVKLRGEYDFTDHWTGFASIGSARTRYDGYLRGTALRLSNVNGDGFGDTINQKGYSDSLSSEFGLRGHFETGSVTHQLVMVSTRLHQEIGRAPAVRSARYPTNLYHPSTPTLAGPVGAQEKAEDNTLTSFAIADTLGFFDEKLLVTVGVRSQRVEQAMSTPSRYDEKKVTPAVALLVKPWDAPVSLYANYIEGLSQGESIGDIRAPNYGEQFAPHQTRQIEAGVKWDLGAFTHTVSVFELENTSVVQDPLTLRYSDDGEQANRGVEWSMFGALTPSLRVLGGVTYTRAVLEKSAGGLFDENTARGVPKWNANLSAEWDVAGVSGLTLSTLVMHSSSQYLDSANNLKAPKFTRYDLGIRYGMSIYERDVTLRASLENVENRAYWAGSFNEGFASIGQPRTLKVSATIDF